MMSTDDVVGTTVKAVARATVRAVARVLAGLTLLVVLGLPTAALAGYDARCDVTVEDYPADGAVNVPLNTLLMYDRIAPDNPFWGNSPELHLEDASGIVSDVWILDSIPEGEYGCAFVSKPIPSLSPLTEYTVREGSATGAVLASFTTGTEEDNTAPELSIVTPPGAWPSVIEYTGSDDIVAFTLEYSDGYLHTFVVHTPPVDGQLTLDWLTTQLNSDNNRTLTAYDRAGNSTEVFLPGYDDGGCSAAGGRVPGLWFGLLLLAMAWCRIGVH